MEINTVIKPLATSCEYILMFTYVYSAMVIWFMSQTMMWIMYDTLG